MEGLPRDISALAAEESSPDTPGGGAEGCPDAEAESQILQSLGADVRDQDELERNINRQADQILTEQANERDQKRLEKAEADKSKLNDQVERLKSRLNGSVVEGSATAARLQAEIDNYEVQMRTLDTDIRQIKERVNERRDRAGEEQNEQAGKHRLPNESQRDFLIRTGKITPFSRIAGGPSLETNLQEALFNAEQGQQDKEKSPESDDEPAVEPDRSHRVLTRPGFVDEASTEPSSETSEDAERPAKRQKVRNAVTTRHKEIGDLSDNRPQSTTPTSLKLADDDAFVPDMDDNDLAALGGSDDEIADASDEVEFVVDTPGGKRKYSSQKTHMPAKPSAQKDDLSGLDDGNEKLYQARLQSWVDRRSAARRGANSRTSDAATTTEAEPGEEWHMPHPTTPDTDFGGGYRMPGDIYPSLFDYQKTGVQWLWELYSQNVGGIVGDEMGLGKTIQAISFLAGLHYSKKITKPIIVVAPATVMKQWVNEFHTWWPPFRVSILHTSGSGMIDVGRESRHEDDLLNRLPGRGKKAPLTKSAKAAKRIVDRVIDEGHILVTTYSGLQTYAELLIPIEWEYAVLDEGHKIRNPNTGITLYCKELRTPNRIILSGTPMQNNLVELWSLFDFIFPMRLGNLLDFKNQFEIPIRIGGYANASNLQIQTAGKCAETLKDAISPYLLQRIKADVASDLPQKTERVLFCRLTKQQRETYEKFLDGDDMKSILNGRRQVLFGIDILRKICNHPDLADHRVLSIKDGYNYGSGVKSGKMVVVKELLNLWKRGGHKTLLFAQHRIMLDILEKYVKTMPGIYYRRMDGTTAISKRQTMVDEFNENPDAHVFLLTTKVGGLGVNLTGADRVIIFDPDWNPSTDIQARERAWRLGQKREVEIYRLMVAGTIEEKIFHRQIFKQFLTNKILKDPKQRQTFQMQDLHDLFTLGNAEEETETGKMFQGTETRFGNDSSLPPVVTDAGPHLNGAPPVAETPSEHGLGDLAGVSSVRPYAAQRSPSDTPPPDTDVKGVDKRIMDSIFARSGVHSALEHDQIINGKRVIAADPAIIEKEAQRIANEAANELKKAETVARALPAGTPTWTGRFGVAGRPGGQRGGGPSSSSIIAGLQDRQAASGGTPDSGGGGRAQGRAAARTTGFLKQIRDYLATHGGRVYTQMLIDHFNRQCTTPQRTAEFKAMLNKIAVLQKGSRGRGAWILRDEYKQARGSLHDA